MNRYCRSGDFRVFKFSRISDFGTLHDNYNSRIFIFFNSAIIIIIFARFLNSRIGRPREISENENLANITRSTASCFNVRIWTVLWGHDTLCLSGVLGWLLIVVLFTPIQRGSQGSVLSVACFTACLYESGHNLRADCQWCTLVPPFDNGANAASVSVQALSALQALMLAVVALKQPAIDC